MNRLAMHSENRQAPRELPRGFGQSQYACNGEYHRVPHGNQCSALHDAVVDPNAPAASVFYAGSCGENVWHVDRIDHFHDNPRHAIRTSWARSDIRHNAKHRDPYFYCEASQPLVDFEFRTRNMT